MGYTGNEQYQTPFSSPQACVLYLYPRRWPRGFHCPFCDRLQIEIAPAETVVCRYCRKQTSITSKTVMHGSKKPLTSWLRAASIFCMNRNGISAREIQQQLGLASYQTAWSILHKLRVGAGLADSRSCRNRIVFDIASPAASTDRQTIQIGCLIELPTEGQLQKKIVLKLLPDSSPDSLTALLRARVEPGSTLYLDKERLPEGLGSEFFFDSLTENHRITAARIFSQSQFWLNSLYRGTIHMKYLQSYLDEFSFRYNTSSWSDRLAVLDHLVTGLVCPLEERL